MTQPHDLNSYTTPGQLIQTLLDLNGWSRKVLAIILGIDESTLNRIIAGTRAVDASLALSLAEVFEVKAEDFLELQSSYELAKARIVARPDPKRADRARIFGNFPVAEMIKRGWLEAGDIRAVPEVEAALLKFFDKESLEQIGSLNENFKKTDATAPPTLTQLAWIYRVRQIAAEMLVPKYSVTGLREGLRGLQNLLASPHEARKAPKILFESGIKYVIVESLSSSKIDGVTFWLDNSPVIGMTLRHDRIDNFWFVLRHEIEHVLRGHGREHEALDVALEGDRAGTGESLSEEERVANEAAANFCVPKAFLDRFMARKFPFFNERDILGFANTMHVHPGLVVGQIQHRTSRYDRFRNHLVKIRSIVAPSAMVDGWGDVAPVGM